MMPNESCCRGKKVLVDQLDIVSWQVTTLELEFLDRNGGTCVVPVHQIKLKPGFVSQKKYFFFVPIGFLGCSVGGKNGPRKTEMTSRA